MIVLVDIDGVVAETQRAWLNLYNRDYCDDLKVADITEWEVHKFVKPACGSAIYGYLKFENLYDGVEPMAGALHGVTSIRGMGHTVRFVSAGFYNGKVKWLHQQGFLSDYPHGSGAWEATRDVVLTADKGLIRGDVLVDDRYDNVAEFPGHGILYTQPWNNSQPWASRASHWGEVVDKIRRMGDDERYVHSHDRVG